MKITIIVNPIGGERKGKQLVEDKIVPLLKQSPEIFITTHPGEVTKKNNKIIFHVSIIIIIIIKKKIK
jgi:hypothetical protein